MLQELELRIETQKQTLQARDESIKKLLEMLQNKGVGKSALCHACVTFPVASRYVHIDKLMHSHMGQTCFPSPINYTYI